MLELLEIDESKDGKHKYIATFKTDSGFKHIPFGALGYSDFTLHKNLERKKKYILRHRTRENWNDPMTAGALSRWILWNKPTLLESIKDFRKRFKL
jgi:hypothetical protein